MGHELTNLFILAGSLFLLFIGYLAYQLASTEKGTRNLLLFFVVCILIFIIQYISQCIGLKVPLKLNRKQLRTMRLYEEKQSNLYKEKGLGF